MRRDGKLLHVDRAGHPRVSSFFNTDETKEEYNASEPVNDRKRWLDQFVHLMGHTGNYTREEAIAAIDADGILPDMLCFDPSKPAKYPNGRVFTDDVIDHRLAFLSKGDIPPMASSRTPTSSRSSRTSARRIRRRASGARDNIRATRTPPQPRNRPPRNSSRLQVICHNSTSTTAEGVSRIFREASQL